MSHIQWPEGTPFRLIELAPEDRTCSHCGRFTHVCDRMHRYLRALGDPVHLVSVVCCCPDKTCPGHKEKRVSEELMAMAPPHWSVGWDLFAWMGHRRFGRHWSVPQIRDELWDRFRVTVSEDVVEDYTAQYEVMVAARQSDMERLREVYRECADLVLCIDGLQPEKGHETLYVVRELNLGRLLFAEPLLSSARDEVRGLFERAREITMRLDKPVRLWMSDKQDAFVSGVAAVFPGVPHRYCQNHFLRDAAKPTLEDDSHAKVQMRRKVRGLREIERTLLAERRAAAQADPAPADPAPADPAPADPAPADPAPADPAPADPAPADPAPADRAPALPPATDDDSTEPQSTVHAPTAEVAPSSMASDEPPADTAQDVVLDYCAVVRGILNDDQGGPLHPPGMRMAQALGEVLDSIKRARLEKKGGSCDRALGRLAACIERGTTLVAETLTVVGERVRHLGEIRKCLDPATGTSKQRREQFDALTVSLAANQDLACQHMAKTMKSFAPGLFAGGDAADLPVDNLDLERSFRLPKGHERRIHGHAHAGVRIVQKGPTLLLTLDAHTRHPDPFDAAELIPWRHAQAPKAQQQCLHRRRVMRIARSSKKRSGLLADLEQRYSLAT